MHHALEIEEILLNIFHRCYSRHDGIDKSDLASLARICRAFKEPALDVLWKELDDLSPLTQCIPDASHQLSPNNRTRSFSRPLTQTEWDTLQRYTRRICRVMDFGSGLDEKSIEILLKPPTTQPLFPKLRYLIYKHTNAEPTHLFHLPFPSLVFIWINSDDPRWFQDSLGSLSEVSPNVNGLHLHMHQSDVTFDKLVSKCICRWQNLRTVDFPNICLDVEALAHLSRVPALTRLTFKQIVTLPDRVSPLFFSNLRDLALHSASLDPISHLLSRIRLPVIESVSAFIYSCPSRQALSSFLASLQSNADRAIKRLSLFQTSSDNDFVSSEDLLLCSEDLRPCMAFSNLHHIHLDVEWKVGLTDSDLLALASAWPNLESLDINVDWGWDAPNGITPNGLLQLLQTCPSLCQVHLAMDTRGYTDLPPSNLVLTLPPHFHLDVLDSMIEAESVPAIVALFIAIASYSNFSLHSWTGCFFILPQGWEVYDARWADVWEQVQRGIGHRDILREETAIQGPST
ncbi:hypothetical protein EV363DRAFT_1586640 [Boletus edulis]|nr:hypothetical protein EV363DRAFT_1586640 [Boletus edulis]